jgi:hypothetical protein
MKALRAATVIAIAMLAVVCVVPMAESDAADSTATLGNPVVGSFDNMSGGKITIPVTYNSFDFGLNIKVIDNYDKEVVYNEKQTVPRGESDIVIDLSSYKSTGNHILNIELMPDLGSGASLNYYSKQVDVDVSYNIFSNWVTFAVIIAAVAIIGAVIYLRSREVSLKKDKENTMTFEQLEAERKAEMAAKSEKKGFKPKASATERKRYKGNE